LDRVIVRHPMSQPAVPLVTNLGPGETEVLMLALESSEAVVVLDDGLARRVAEAPGIRLTGTMIAQASASNELPPSTGSGRRACYRETR